MYRGINKGPTNVFHCMHMHLEKYILKAYLRCTTANPSKSTLCWCRSRDPFWENPGHRVLWLFGV